MKHRIRITPYTFNPHGTSTRGAALYLGRTFRVFIPAQKLHDVADKLHDIAEAYEQEQP